MIDLTKTIADFTGIATLPSIYTKVKNIIDDPHSTTEDLADAISLDPGLCVRLLKIVNSAFYSFPNEIGSIPQALNILGRNQIHDMVLATSVANAFPKIPEDLVSMHAYWRNCVYTGLAAKNLGKQCNYIDCDQLFIEGLLSDVGHMVLYYQVPEVCENAIRHAREQIRPVHIIEYEMLGLEFSTVGAALLENWNLPEYLVESIRQQLNPEEDSDYAFSASILNISWAMTQTTLEENLVQLIHPLSWKNTGLTLSQLHEIRTEVEKDCNSILELIYPQARDAA